MTSSKTEYNIEHVDDDDSEDNSFESALCEEEDFYDSGTGGEEPPPTERVESTLCEMYNDILNHVAIPEDEEVSFSEKACGDDASLLANKDAVFIQQDSFCSCRSMASASIMTIGSSYMLSAGGESEDDDLSFMTELSGVEDEIEIMSIGTSDNILLTEASESVLSTEGESMLSTEASEYIDHDKQTGEPHIPSKYATSKTPEWLRIYRDRNILSRSACDTKGALTLSDLGAALISPSTQSPNPDCNTTLDCSDGSKCSFDDYRTENSGVDNY